MNIETKLTMGVTHKITTYYADGSICKEYPEQKNMITDAGMDLAATTYLAAMSLHMHIGTGTDVQARTLETGTFSQSGTTVTADLAFFVAADATNGRLLVFTDGTQAVVTSYTSSTEVTVDRSQTVAAQVATLYYVEITALTTEVEDSTTYETTTGAYGSSMTTVGDVMTITHKRTGLSAESYPTGATITEIGLSPTGGDLFARLLLATPVEIPADGSMGNAHTITHTVDLSTATLTTPITGVAIDATAALVVNSDLALTDFTQTVSGTGVSGPTNITKQQHWSLEPYVALTNYSIIVSDDADPLTDTTDSSTNSYTLSYTNPTYVAGSFEHTLTATINGGSYSDTAWRTIAYGSVNSSNMSYKYRLLFDSDATFLVSNQLDVTFTKTWVRG